MKSGVPVKPMKDAFGRKTHVAREPAGLGAVCFVRHDDDVVAAAVRFSRVHILIEFVDQTKNVTVVLFEPRLELLA